MTVRRFTLEFDGEVFYCAAWPLQRERDRAAPVEQGERPAPPSPPATAPQPPEPRVRGRRRNFDAVLSDAVGQLGDRLQGLSDADQVRLVLWHLAVSDIDPACIPGERTARQFIAQHVGKNVGKKSCKKSNRGRIAPNRRSDRGELVHQKTERQRR